MPGRIAAANMNLARFPTVLLAKLAQGFLLDLTHTLARQSKALANFFERQRVLTADTEVQARDLGFARVKQAQSTLNINLERLVHECIIRLDVFVIRKNVKEAVVIILVERGIHGEMTTGVLKGFADLVYIHFQLSGQFFDVRLTLVDLRELCARLADLRNRTNSVQRQSHNTALFGQRLQDRLTDPPNGVRDELETTRFIETLCRLDQAVVSFVDEVSQRKPLPLLLLGNGYHEAKVCSGQTVQCILVSLLDLLR